MTPHAPPRAEDDRQRRRRCGAAGTQKKGARSPTATQRHPFSPCTTSSSHWAHPDASMRRYGSPIARRRAPPNTRKRPRGRRRRRARRREGAKKCATEPRRDPEAPVYVPDHAQYPLGPPWCVNTTLRFADRATARAFTRRRTPQMAARAAPAARAVPRRRKTMCHEAQTRPRGASLGPPPPPCLPSPPWCVNTALRLADRATARAFARHRTSQNDRTGGLCSARGRRGGGKGPTDPKCDLGT